MVINTETYWSQCREELIANTQPLMGHVFHTAPSQGSGIISEGRVGKNTRARCGSDGKATVFWTQRGNGP